MTKRSTHQVLESILRALDEVDHTAREVLPHQDRVELAKLGRQVARRIDALAGVLVGEADAAGSTLATTATPTRSWLALPGQETSKEAAGAVYAGRDLIAREGVRDAALAGQIGVGQARAITKALGEMPATLTPAQRREAEQRLLERAEHASAPELVKAGRDVLAEVAPEYAETADDQHKRLEAQRRRALRRRSLSWWSDGDGSMLFKGSLPELEGTGFIKQIEAHVESDRRTARERYDRRDFRHEQPTPEQRRADALLALVKATQHGKQTPNVAGDRPRIVVTMQETALHDRAEQAGLLESGSQISAGDLRRLCCDADLTPIVLGTRSEVLDVGHTIRLVTPGIRKALTARNGGCVFPGCHVPATSCDAHHIVPWWDGGATSLDNLVSLCTHHHQLVEPPKFWSGAPPDRWQIRLDPQGSPEVIPPKRVDPDRKAIPCRARNQTRPSRLATSVARRDRTG